MLAHCMHTHLRFSACKKAHFTILDLLIFCYFNVCWLILKGRENYVMLNEVSMFIKQNVKLIHSKFIF